MGEKGGGSPTPNSQRQWADETLSPLPASFLIFNKDLFVTEVWLSACLPRVLEDGETVTLALGGCE